MYMYYFIHLCTGFDGGFVLRYRSETDEEELRKIFAEHGTVVKFKFFE